MLLVVWPGDNERVLNLLCSISSFVFKVTQDTLSRRKTEQEKPGQQHTISRFITKAQAALQIKP